MRTLISKINGPHFSFLVFPENKRWERRGRLKKECHYHPDALRIQDVIVTVFRQAFEQSHTQFHYYGPTEYLGDDLPLLREMLAEEIKSITSCRTPKQFRARLSPFFTSTCDDDIGEWLPEWRRMRNELEVVGQQILRCVDQAEREQKALLVLGI